MRRGKLYCHAIVRRSQLASCQQECRLQRGGWAGAERRRVNLDYGWRGPTRLDKFELVCNGGGTSPIFSSPGWAQALSVKHRDLYGVKPGWALACQNITPAYFEHKLFTNKNYKIHIRSYLKLFRNLGSSSLEPAACLLQSRSELFSLQLCFSFILLTPFS